MEPTESTTTAATEQIETKAARPEYTGDKGLVDMTIPRNEQVEKKPVAQFSYGNRVRIASLHNDYEKMLDHIIQVGGWARTTRMGGKDFCFIELTDGSGSGTLQCVVDSGMPDFDQISKANVGTSFKIMGKLIRSPAKGQSFELQVCQADTHAVKIIGECPGDSYPLAKKKHSVEYLRELAHLRPRTKMISAVTRVRNNLSYATHKFFQERGFLYVHTPIITASDCEGAGEMFQVTTALPPSDKPLSQTPQYTYVGEELEAEKPAEELSKKKQKKQKKKDGEAPVEEEKKEEAPKQMIPADERLVNYKKDFFGKPAMLTVSGQLSVENYCCSVGDVYTFGPTFRAENSNTSRHLAEFWMIEPELAFAELTDVMDCAEDYTKYCVRYILENNKDDVAFFNQWVDKELAARMANIAEEPFKRISYTEAVELLAEHLKEKKVKFQVKPVWGLDLGSEHERYLAEKVFQRPTIVYNYPKDFKAFYMKQNQDGKTVQAMDMLVPGIGELIGGSAREESLEKLDAMIKEKGLELEPYWWYRDLRKFGTQPHGGFGLGFERLVMLCTGVENIRDVIPFPRYPRHADF